MEDVAMTAAAGTVIEPLDDRDVRALTEYMSTLPNVGIAAGAEGIFTVISESGRSYTVDVETGACDCDDAFYRQPTGGCKHVRRVQFATGRRSIPEWVNEEAIDEQLGLHVGDT
jgi:hypothetical protein